MTGTVKVDVPDRLIHAVHDPDRQDQIQVFGEIVLFGRRQSVGNKPAECLVAPEFHLVFPHGGGEEGNETGSDLPVDEQRFEGVAGTGPLTLGVDHDLHRLFQIAGLVHEKVADPLVVLEDGHGGFGHDGPHQTFPAPGNDEVDATIHFEEQFDRFPVPPGDQLDGARGDPAGHSRPVEDPGQTHVRIEGFTAAPEHDRIPGLEADRRGVHGHIGTGFVDDADHAEGHRHLGDLQPVGADPFFQHPAHGILLRGHGADALRHSGDPFFIQLEPVEHGAGKPLSPAVFEVGGIGFEDGRGLLFDHVGRPEQKSGLGFGTSNGQDT